LDVVLVTITYVKYALMVTPALLTFEHDTFTVPDDVGVTDTGASSDIVVSA
jgi:hypothetical protein